MDPTALLRAAPPRPHRDLPGPLRGGGEVAPHDSRLPRDAHALLSAASRRTKLLWTRTASGPTTSSPISSASPPAAPTPVTATSARCVASAPWLRVAGYTENDPFRGLRNVRLPRKRSCRRWRPPRSPACSPAAIPVRPMGRRDRAILLTLLDTGIRCCGGGPVGPRGLRAGGAARVDRSLRSSRESRTARWRSGGCSCGRARAARTASCPSPGAAPMPSSSISRTAVRPRGRSSSPPATRASTPACVSGRTGSNSCCAGSAGPRASDGSTRIASATRSPPGPSPTTPASSMSSTCLGHSSPEMVRRYSATYGSAQAAERHAAFSPGDGMLVAAR